MHKRSKKLTMLTSRMHYVRFKVLKFRVLLNNNAWSHYVALCIIVQWHSKLKTLNYLNHDESVFMAIK